MCLGVQYSFYLTHLVKIISFVKHPGGGWSINMSTVRWLLLLVFSLPMASHGAEPLPIPPLLEQTASQGKTRLFDLTVQEGRVRFVGKEA